MIRDYQFYNGKDSEEKFNSNDIIKAIESIPAEELGKYGFSLSKSKDDLLLLTGRHVPRVGGFTSCIHGSVSNKGLCLITNEDCVTINKYTSKLEEVLDKMGLKINIREKN